MLFRDPWKHGSVTFIHFVCLCVFHVAQPGVQTSPRGSHDCWTAKWKCPLRRQRWLPGLPDRTCWTKPNKNLHKNGIYGPLNESSECFWTKETIPCASTSFSKYPLPQWVSQSKFLQGKTTFFSQETVWSIIFSISTNRLRRCPTFWSLWATLEVELSWTTRQL